MSKTNKKESKYPTSFIKEMKKKKRKKIRNYPIYNKIIEQQFNDASIII